ncbi:MAG: FkbM family methyltransferase [Anaerolineales bacterium]
MASPLLNLAAAAARLLPEPFKRALYRLGPASRGLRAALNRSAPPGLSETQIAAGDLAGTHLLLNLQTEKDYWLGTYETDLQQAIKDWGKAGMVAFDLGANIGYVSLLLAHKAGEGGKVFAFEALPANQKRLQQNLALNPKSKVELVPKAVTDKKGKAAFLIHPSGGMGKVQGSLGKDAEFQSNIEVETIAIDDFVFKQRNPPPDLIKIDIEGGEVLALRGMRRILLETRPLLLIELHGREADEFAWEILGNARYSLHHMRKGYPKVAAIDELGKKSYLVAKPA